MLRHILRDTLKLNWTGERFRPGLPCSLTLAVALLTGLAFGRPASGMVAAGGAMCVGFGAFQALGRSRITPMFWASIGMSVCTAIGSIVPHTLPGLLVNAACVGFGYGILTALGPGTAWIGLQCGIAALIATAYPTGLQLALARAVLVLAGGLLQMGMVIFFRRLHEHFDVPVQEDPFVGFSPAARLLGENFTLKSEAFRYALKLAAALALAVVAAHFLALSNGYWVPMTALLVLRTDVRETFTRGLARVLGTFVGAGLATLLASQLRPDPWSLSALVVLFAWLCYSVVNVNYGVFSVCVTAYIAFLLSFAGLPEKEVALHRIANTTLGGMIALAATITTLAPRRRASVTVR
jgi:hypothetical protein